MARAETEIINKLGLHARASAKLTQLAGKFDCDIWMEKGSRRINAKSIMGVMMLAASHAACQRASAAKAPKRVSRVMSCLPRCLSNGADGAGD